MAIKDLNKTGSYSRIIAINTLGGRVIYAEMNCYETTPKYSLKELNTLTEVEEENSEGDKIKVTKYPEETTKIIHKYTFEDTDLPDEVDASVSLHKQVYTHLHTLDLFSGSKSDE